MKRATFITWEQLKVGSVIVIALLVLTLAMYKLGEAANLFSSRYKLVAMLEGTSGLREGGQVTLAGQMVGTVSKIEFLPVDADTARNVKITLEVNEEIREQIRADSRARLRTQGLLGDKVIDITPGTPRYDVLDPLDTILVANSLDYEQIIAQASEAVDDMVALTQDLRSITGGIVKGEGTMGQLLTNRALYDELTSTLSRTNQLLGRLQNPNGTVGRLLDDPQLYTQLTAVLGSTDSLLRQLNSKEGTIGALLHDDTLYASLRSMATRGDSLMRMLTSGNGLASKMLTDQQLYDQLVKLTTDLNAILEDVRRDPRRYTRGMIKVF